MLSAQMGVIMGMSPEHVLERLTLREAFIFLATAEAMSSPAPQAPDVAAQLRTDLQAIEQLQAEVSE